MRGKVSNFKKEYIIVGLFILVVFGISLGYSRLQTLLTINGNANIPKVSWKVHFKNLKLSEDSFTNAGANTVSIDDAETTLTYTVTLTKPGDKFSFDVDIANDGSLDAILTSIEETGTAESDYINKPYFNYTVTGLPSDGEELNSGNTKKVTITVEFPDVDDAADLPTEDFTFTKTIKLNYAQKVNATSAVTSEATSEVTE